MCLIFIFIETKLNMSRLLDCGWTGPNGMRSIKENEGKKITERLPWICFESTLEYYNFKGTREEEENFMNFVYDNTDKHVQILLDKLNELDAQIRELKK